MMCPPPPWLPYDENKIYSDEASFFYFQLLRFIIYFFPKLVLRFEKYVSSAAILMPLVPMTLLLCDLDDKSSCKVYTLNVNKTIA